MAKRPTIVTLTGSFGSQAAINTSLENIQAAFDNTISRDGSTPNTMEADLDLNNNDLLNIGEATINRLIVQGVNVTPTQLVNITVPDWEGAWTTATAYEVNDLVRESGSSYICLVAHTSGTFSTDLSAGRWELFAQAGSAGAGSGDLLAANNLNDLVNADTALANLGGGATGIAIFKDTTAAAVRTEIGLGDAATKGVTGADANAVTGTAGTDGNLGQWNVDGDLVDGPAYGTGAVANQLVQLDGSGNLPALDGSNLTNIVASDSWTESSVTATTSGTTIDFTSLPSGITEIELWTDEVSLNGTSDLLVQIGTSADGFVSTGYSSETRNTANGGSTSTAGFRFYLGSAARTQTALMTLRKVPGTNGWVAVHQGKATGFGIAGGGSVTLTSALDRVRLTSVAGNTFDNGQCWIRYK